MNTNTNANAGASKQPARPALGKGLASLLPGAAPSPVEKAKQMMGDIPSVEQAAQPAAQPAPAVAPSAPAEAPAAAEAAPIASKERIPGITLADVDQIVANQYQPRRDFDETSLLELAESISINGVIQPLVVRKGDDGKLHLIAGERRLRASKLAGLKQVPIVIRKSTDKEALELALIENIQREDLNCVDVALSYQQLAEEFRLTQEEIAKRVAKDRVSVANHLRLLKLPESILGDLRSGRLTFGHGRALLSVTDPLKRIALRNRIVEKSLSVRETERLVAESMVQDKGSEEKAEKSAGPSAELLSFSERLGRALGTKVKTKGDQYRGSIVIEYFSKEDLDRISEQLMR
jgi:ParB family transcriptional regulator, chromosome partitioning protein